MRHSPLTGDALLVHLCLADQADSARGDRVEIGADWVAAMTRTRPDTVTAVIDRMVAARLAVVLSHLDTNGPLILRLLCDPDAPVVFDRFQTHRKAGPHVR